jgi:2-C-methyl-D-erythritol 2,4-cyclodiphosphate synthase/2-C-methyl-D-erythritol 4-phosphate cytidylyltransferase
MRYWLVMPAAGSGSRFAADLPKQYAVLAGRTVIEWALAPFLADPRCAHAVVVLAERDGRWPAVAARLSDDRVSSAPGGGQRSESVRSGLAALRPRLRDEDWVLVHDAARPCLEPADLEQLIARAGAHEAGGLLAVPAADSLKRSARGEGVVAASVERTGLWRALTPQMFRYGRLCAALDAAHAGARYPGDEAQALEWLGATPLLVEGAATNLKITTPADLELAAAVLRARGARLTETAMRIGSGVDVHAFGPGELVVLGGVRIPHTRGVIAHSDGDVVLHALCDALLGGAGLGDIGQHFPDTDPAWRGADSRRFVAAVLGMLRERGLTVENADLTVMAQAPKIAPYREAMRREVATLLGIALERVSVKATTTEGLGFLGRAEGIAAQAVVLLRGT